jgi:hypothetical protein
VVLEIPLQFLELQLATGVAAVVETLVMKTVNLEVVAAVLVTIRVV